MVYNAGMGAEELPDAGVLIEQLEERYFLKEFFDQCYPHNFPFGDLRLEASELYTSFPLLRKDRVDVLERYEAASEANIVRGITLVKLAGFAKERFEESFRALGRADMTSQNFYNLKYDTNRWSKLEEITRSAAELEENDYR